MQIFGFFMEENNDQGFVAKLSPMSRLKGFFASSKRVFVIAKKPLREEFWTMVKVTGIGIVVIAIIGFIIQLIFAFTGIGFA